MSKIFFFDLCKSMLSRFVLINLFFFLKRVGNFTHTTFQAYWIRSIRPCVIFGLSLRLPFVTDCFTCYIIYSRTRLIVKWAAQIEVWTGNQRRETFFFQIGRWTRAEHMVRHSFPFSFFSLFFFFAKEYSRQFLFSVVIQVARHKAKNFVGGR